jgi:lysozyme
MDMQNGQMTKERESITDYEVSPAGVTLLKKFEGLSTRPYICPGGTLTVGYGQCISQKKFDTQYPNGFSEKDAENLLRSTLNTSYVADIKRLVKVPLYQREFDMLVSLNYNIGAKVLSDHQRNILPLINASNYEEAPLEFLKFTKGGPEKKYYRGLLKRRMTEMFVFRNSVNIPEALRAPIEDDNFRRVTKCDSIARYWEESGQQSLRDEAISLYKAYNGQAESSETIR